MSELPPPQRPGNDQEPDQDRSSASLPTRLMTVGIEFAAVVAILTLAGWWLDQKWGTGPWLLLTGMFVSTIGGLYKVWRLGKKFF